MEAAIQLQIDKEPSVELVDKIVRIAGNYKSDKHTNVDDILPNISRYNKYLDQVEYLQLQKENAIDMFETMENRVSQTGNDVSCVVTAPPESFFLHLTINKKVIMFDSHPRRHLGLKNSHFLIFKDKYQCLKYLETELLKTVKLDVTDIDPYQMQAMNVFEASMLCLKSDLNRKLVKDEPDEREYKKQAAQLGNKLHREWNEEQKQFANYENHNNNKSGRNGYKSKYDNYNTNEFGMETGGRSSNLAEKERQEFLRQIKELEEERDYWMVNVFFLCCLFACLFVCYCVLFCFVSFCLKWKIVNGTQQN